MVYRSSFTFTLRVGHWQLEAVMIGSFKLQQCCVYELPLSQGIFFPHSGHTYTWAFTFYDYPGSANTLSYINEDKIENKDKTM